MNKVFVYKLAYAYEVLDLLRAHKDRIFGVLNLTQGDTLYINEEEGFFYYQKGKRQMNGQLMPLEKAKEIATSFFRQVNELTGKTKRSEKSISIQLFPLHFLRLTSINKQVNPENNVEESWELFYEYYIPEGPEVNSKLSVQGLYLILHVDNRGVAAVDYHIRPIRSRRVVESTLQQEGITVTSSAYIEDDYFEPKYITP